MRAHYLQHVAFEGPGSIGPWLQQTGYEVHSTHLYQGDQLPDAGEIDLLVVMGGPMSVNDEQDYPWLREEKRLIKAVIERGVPTLGICLGAQLIASALGCQVMPSPEKEIGWLPIQGLGDDSGQGFQFPPRVEVFHWHGETFELPPGAIRLAQSAACLNQAFQLGRHVIGLQFHLETTPASARAILEHCRGELQEAPYIQGEKAILAAGPEHYATINGLMNEVLIYLQHSNPLRSTV